MDAVTIVWLISRTGLWSNWEGLRRVGVNLVAFGYGRALLQRHVIGPFRSISFNWIAGFEYQDYATGAFQILGLLAVTWLTVP